ncbi:MAG: HD domain-containing protein [Gemmatimonadota bacterium]
MQHAALLDDAAAGRLPEWAAVSAGRRAHMERVAELMATWADVLGLPAGDRTRWRAAGLLHDVLRETPPDDLRPLVAEPLRTVAGKLLHGPAAAARLREHGLRDEPLLSAITYHTIGHPGLDDLGRALFIADYIEPGRMYDADELAALRARMPHDLDAVLLDVLRRRMQRLAAEGRPIRPETAAFWNLVSGARAATA